MTLVNQYITSWKLFWPCETYLSHWIKGNGQLCECSQMDILTVLPSELDKHCMTNGIPPHWMIIAAFSGSAMQQLFCLHILGKDIICFSMIFIIMLTIVKILRKNPRNLYFKLLTNTRVANPTDAKLNKFFIRLCYAVQKQLQYIKLLEQIYALKT